MTEEQRIERIVQELGDTVTGMTDFCGEKQLTTKYMSLLLYYMSLIIKNKFLSFY